jgi:hypothetical protein
MLDGSSRAPRGSAGPVYRSADLATRLRLEQLAAELGAVRREITALEAEVESAEREAARLIARVNEAGPGAGEADPVRDRVGLASSMLVGSSVPLVALHVAWHEYVARDVSVVPAILLLGAPGLLAAIVALPHARRSAACWLGFALGASFALLAVVHVLAGRLG